MRLITLLVEMYQNKMPHDTKVTNLAFILKSVSSKASKWNALVLEYIIIYNRKIFKHLTARFGTTTST